MKQVKIKSIKMSNFKGSGEDKEIVFYPRTMIAGKNGSGKTTIADSYFWTIDGKDYSLKSNPVVKPENSEDDCKSLVEIELEVGGLPLRLSKSQKTTTKESATTSKTTVTTTNSFTLNGAKKSEKDFKAELKEYGIDTDIFLALSHLKAFTAGKKEDMRKVLMKMATATTDQELASSNPELKYLSDMLAINKLDNIVSAYKSEQKQAENDVSSLNATISVLQKEVESRKDISDLELQKNALAEQVEELQKHKTSNREIINKLYDEIRELNDKCNEEWKKLKAEKDAEKEHLRLEFKAVSDKENEVFEQLKTIERKNDKLWDVEEDLSSEIENLRLKHAELKKFEPVKFDESTTICPVCKRELPEDKITEIKAEYEATKQAAIDKNQNDLAEVIKTGNALIASRKNTKKQMEELAKQIIELDKQHKELEVKCAEARHAYSNIPYTATPPEFDRKTSIAVAEKEKIINELALEDKLKNAEIDEKIKALNNEIITCEADIKIIQESNDKIAEAKQKLRESQGKFGYASKVLDDVSQLVMLKNNAVLDEVNSNFEGVKVQLFNVQKNGEIKDDCIWYVNDNGTWKSLENASNKALQLKGKLAIVKGLQRFYDVSYPIFVDDAESFDSENLNDITADGQIVYLKVSDSNLEVINCDAQYGSEG